MAKKQETAGAPGSTETKTRKPRVPRTLTDLEIEAKQQFEDAKSLGKILPAIDLLGPWGRQKLAAHIELINAAIAQEEP